MSYICMVVDGAYPQDIRVRKEAEALASFGKKVLVVCPRKKNDCQKETLNGVEVFRIGANYTNTKKGIYDIIESVSNLNPFFYRGLKKVCNEYKIDFLHIHDLPLAGTGLRFRTKVKRALYLDLHENFPEALKTWFDWRKSVLIKLKNRLFMHPEKWSKKEEIFCNAYDKVICVVEEMKQKLITNFGIDKNKLVVVSNFEKILQKFSIKKLRKILSVQQIFQLPTWVGLDLIGDYKQPSQPCHILSNLFRMQNYF
jgi:glycosyltransferase involved in cell wall biosynthesis